MLNDFFRFFAFQNENYRDLSVLRNLIQDIPEDSTLMSRQSRVKTWKWNSSHELVLTTKQKVKYELRKEPS